MPVTKVKSKWESGDLIFEDLSGNEIARLIGSTAEFKIGTTPVASGDRLVKVAKIALGDAATVGGVFSWENDEGAAVLVTRVLLNVTTAATVAATIDVGHDDGGDVSSDNLIDGLDVNAATGLFDNIDDGGTNGAATALVPDGEFVVASEASGDVTGLVGNAYIEYVVV